MADLRADEKPQEPCALITKQCRRTLVAWQLDQHLSAGCLGSSGAFPTSPDSVAYLVVLLLWLPVVWNALDPLCISAHVLLCPLKWLYCICRAKESLTGYFPSHACDFVKLSHANILEPGSVIMGLGEGLQGFAKKRPAKKQPALSPAASRAQARLLSGKSEHSASDERLSFYLGFR